MADMEQKTTTWVKKEGRDEDIKDPVCMVQLYPSSSNIKEELQEDVYKEPLEDPLNIVDPSLHVKQDIELKQHVDCSEDQGCRMADMEQKTTTWVKKEGTDEDLKEPVCMPLEDPLNIEEPSLHVKQDIELKQHVDGSERKFVEDPLGISWPTDYLKEDPELHLEVDGTKNTMLPSTGYESNSTRLHQSTGGSCGISLEETVNQGVISNGLEIGPEDSAHTVMSNTNIQRWTSQEGTLFDSNLKCSLREKEFHKFSCSSCLQSFSSKYRLIMHVFIHVNGVQPPSFVCKSCGEVFPSNFSLNQHLNHVEGHKAKRDHKCDVRAKSFTLLSSLKKHTSIHTGIRPHTCDVCGKSFARFYDLKQHTLIHTGIRLHTCDVCGMSFNDLPNLRRHTLIHSGIKAHKCDVCGKSFARLGTLRIHTLIHTGIRPHMCDICGKSFTQLGSLKSHTLIHSGMRPHTCGVCGKSFAKLCNLKEHSLIHTGMRPHPCLVCGKSFTQLATLKNHTLIHTGIRSHSCDICGKSFTRLGALKTHTAIHTVKNST